MHAAFRSHHGAFVAGEFRVASSGGWFEALDAADPALVADCGPTDAAEALAAARTAAEQWAATPALERSRHLYRFADALAAAGGDAAEAAFVEAGWADKLSFAVPALAGPRGVVTVLASRHDTAPALATAVTAALAAGNTVVVKGSPLTPLRAVALAEAAALAGLPAGTLNVICGDDSCAVALVALLPDAVAVGGRPETASAVAAATVGSATVVRPLGARDGATAALPQLDLWVRTTDMENAR